MKDLALESELAARRSGGGGDGLALAHLVARRVRREVLPSETLDALTDIARRHHGHDPFLDAFLASVLPADQLALPLLALVLERSGLDAESFAVLLLTDVVRHENRHPDRRDPAAGRRRVRRAARCVWTVDRSLDADASPPPSVATEWLALTVLTTSPRPEDYLAVRARQVHRVLSGAPVATIRAGLLLRLVDGLVPDTAEETALAA